VTAGVVLANFLLGAAYVAMGTIALYEVTRGWRDNGFSRFGAALVALAFTCGPHHLTHAVHVGFEHQRSTSLDLVTVLVGLPPAMVWLYLRLEALVGRRGDRFIEGTPAWMRTLPMAGGAYLGAVLVAGVLVLGTHPALRPETVLGLANAAVFGTLGFMFLRTQLRNHAAVQGWSASGVGLTGVFTTCSVMHFAVAMQLAAGTAHLDVHLVMIDAGAFVACVYFLSVVRRLTRELLQDWNTIGVTAAAAA
jgi:hypothetical protein